MEFIGHIKNINEKGYGHNIGLIRLDGYIIMMPFKKKEIKRLSINHVPGNVLRKLNLYKNEFILHELLKSPVVGETREFDYTYRLGQYNLVYDVMVAMLKIIPKANYVTHFKLKEFDDDVEIKYQGSFETFDTHENAFYCYMMFDTVEDRLETNTILSLYNFEVLGEFSKYDFPVDLDNGERYKIFKL